jgi:hypothetical protein
VDTSSAAPASATAGHARADGGDESPADGARGIFAALSVRNFRRYVSGQALSLIGTWVETVAQALLVLRLTHSGVILGLTTAARFAPVLLLSPYAGLLVGSPSGASCWSPRPGSAWSPSRWASWC